uniref:MIP07992p n=1 Tax=Drosophila melanogaster TaxID=7227 RepID=C0PVB9_DROME|nr:MIP07992p [Drosophila melanogaster]
MTFGKHKVGRAGSTVNVFSCHGNNCPGRVFPFSICKHRSPSPFLSLPPHTVPHLRPHTVGWPAIHNKRSINICCASAQIHNS